ncbi:MAG: SDR family NAD(P)-dependent oxidoreductase, partial [Pseudomonadota bacterium]
MNDNGSQVVLVTGAARRIGAGIIRKLHAQGMNIVLHYNSSIEAANSLVDELNNQRESSITALQFDLAQTDQLGLFADRVMACWGRLDVLVNNASTFYPTPVDQMSLEQWDDLTNVNLKAPLFLCQVFASELDKRSGNIIN